MNQPPSGPPPQQPPGQPAGVPAGPYGPPPQQQQRPGPPQGGAPRPHPVHSPQGQPQPQPGYGPPGAGAPGHSSPQPGQWGTPPPQGRPPHQSPPGKSKAGKIALIVGAVVVLLAIVGVGGYLGGILMRGGGIGGSAPHESRESPAPPPVPATKLTEALSAEGFGCFQTLETPTAVHSCYRTEDDGTRLVARVVSGQQGTSDLVEILAQPPLGIAGQGLPPGDAATPVKEVFTVVGENLFGPAADQLPSFDAGDSRSASLSWGTVSFDLAPEAGTAKFSRAGAPTMPRGADFSAQASAAEGKLAAAGYECDGSGCTGRSQTFDIDAGVTSGEVSMSVMGYDGKPKVTDAELKKHYTDLLRAVADPAALPAAQAWVNEHLKPANGLDQADVGGLHLVVIRTATGDGQLIVTPVLAD